MWTIEFRVKVIDCFIIKLVNIRRNCTNTLDSLWSPCGNGAACRSSADGTTAVHAYQCRCLPGYAHGYCDYAFQAMYSTLCRLDDANCDVDVDECASSPCQHGSTCSESFVNQNVSVHTYRCTCVAGYGNGRCDYAFISEFQEQCTVMESDQSSTWSGNCDLNIDECASNPCQNGAECVDSATDATVIAR